MKINRKTRRAAEKIVKGQAKQKFTLLELQKSISIAMEMRHASLGHLFTKELKERCVFCGKTRRVKTECDYWFLTFLDRLQTILINPGFFSNDDIEAIWFQHAAEYAGIQIPLLKAKEASEKA